ncbi:MAG: hypothetical protein JWP44_4054 [Mucilaginibacter sp.]|nr:hypothetical protein [Mucilaginibacter sp.]
MKTQILTIFTALIIGSGIANSTYAATAKNETVTVLNDISAINKIEVHGNVLLYVSDGTADQVKVYNKYYAESALVKSKNGVLSIASCKAEKLVVWVTASDLRSIAAYDNAEVKSFGHLSKVEFEVDLYNNASAKLDMDAITAKVAVNDQAKATLSGNADEYDLKYAHVENIKEADFTSTHASKTQTGIDGIAKAKIDDFADL